MPIVGRPSYRIWDVKLPHELEEGVKHSPGRTKQAVHPSSALTTRRQWLTGAAIGGTALMADAALRPASAMAQTNQYVDLTSNQTIGGVKTFSQPPVVPAGTFALPQVPGTAMVAANATGPFAPSSPGATAPTRYVGGTTSGAPTTGSFALGDFVVDHTAALWICTVGGTPGTWVQQRTIPAGNYLGREGPVIGATPQAVVGSARVAGDASDRLQLRADGAIVVGLGSVAPALVLKPSANASAWEINNANLKIRSDTDVAVAPEIHLHSINGIGTDHLAWGIGIDVANLAGPARDLAFFKGIGSAISDEFYGNHRGSLPSTWAFGQAPADDSYKLSVVAGGIADLAMGGLKIQIGGTTTGNALTLRDGLRDRVWLDSQFWVRGHGNVSGAALQIKADATSSRTLAVALGDGSGAFGFEHNGSSFIRFRAISTATNIVQFGANGTTFLYGPVTMNAGATVQGGNLSMQENRHVVLGTTTGTKIGTAPNQKLGFFNVAPVAQPSGTPPAATDVASATALVNDLRSKLLSLGLIA